MTETQPFGILYVCGGNVAQSPLASALTAAITGDASSQWQVASGGTHATAGAPVRAEALRAADALGVDLSGHRARAVDVADCERADVIIGMTWDHVSYIWSLVPEAWDRCFTIKEFVHWAKQAPVRPPILFPDAVEHMRDKVAQVHAVRKRARADLGFWGGLRPQELNLPEPTGKGEAIWRNFTEAVRLLVTDAVRLLEGPRESQTPERS